MSMIHKTRMDKNIFTAFDHWILFCSCGRDQVSFSFLSCFLLSRKCKKNVVKAQQINPTYESKKNFWEEKEEEGMRMVTIGRLLQFISMHLL